MKNELYKAIRFNLSKYGVGKSRFKKMSPIWWNYSIRNNESLCIQLALYFAKRLKIPTKKIIDY